MLNDHVVIMYFTAKWCAPCKTFGPRLSKFIEETPGVGMVRIDVDDHPDFAAKYDVMSVPTTIWFNGNTPKLTLVGAQDEAKLNQALYTTRES